MATKQVEANPKWCEETNYINYLSYAGEHLGKYVPAISFLQNPINLPGIIFRCASEVFVLQVIIAFIALVIYIKMASLAPIQEIERAWGAHRNRVSKFSYTVLNIVAPVIFVGLGWWIWYDGGGYRPKTVRGALLSWGSTYSFFIGMGCFVILQVRTYCHYRKKAKTQTQVKGRYYGKQ